MAPLRCIAEGRRTPRGHYSRPQQNELSLTAFIVKP